MLHCNYPKQKKIKTLKKKQQQETNKQTNKKNRDLHWCEVSTVDILWSRAGLAVHLVYLSVQRVSKLCVFSEL